MAAPIGFGNWQQSIDTFCHLVENTDDFNLFRSLKSNKERVEFIFHRCFLKHVQWLPTYFEACKTWHGKSAEVSKVWRNKGNKYFQLKQYKTAVDAYTQSCLNAPVGSGDNLALAFGNRSAALFHLELYKECLLDIQRATESGFPVDSFHKLLSRKTSALLRLGQIKQAEQSYQMLKEFVNGNQFSLNGSSKEEFLKEVASLAAQFSERKTSIIDHPAPAAARPSVYIGINLIVSQASKALTLNNMPEKGRHLLANRFIPKGSSIIVERPFAAVLLPDQYENLCHHCFSKLPVTSIGCDQCTYVQFCNEVCKEASWTSYHKTECRYLDLLHSVGIAHLSLRIVLCAKLPFLKDFLLNNQKYRLSDDVLAKGLNQNGKYDRSYISVYDLMTHEENTEPLDMLQYTLTAALLLTTLIHSGVFHQVDASGDAKCVSHSLIDFMLGMKQDSTEKLPADISDVGDLLLRHILQLVCNAHAITSLQAVSRPDEVSQTHDTEQMENILLKKARNCKLFKNELEQFSSKSKRKRDYSGQVSLSFIGDTLIVRTVHDVNSGEEIFNCYGPHHCRMRREERQEILKSQYHFDCFCTRCSSGDSCKERFSALKCPSCRGVLLILHLEQMFNLLYSYDHCLKALKCPSCGGVLLKTNTCANCGHTLDGQTCAELKKKLDITGELFSQGVHMMSRKQFEAISKIVDKTISDAIKLLEDCLRQRQNILYQDHKDLALVQDALARCYASTGDFSQSADHLYSSISLARQMYGDKSVEYSHELLKLAEVLFNAERFTECLTIAEQCLALFSSLYPSGHENIQQVMELKVATQLALAPMMEAHTQKQSSLSRIQSGYTT
ncbi:SET and MYND domain-containing protein 4 [Biomphalaria pfeifferi]|uniref:Protein-lysine N-methyltransferase SMYD4 n=1 Tax=Biomphalaria pfeifferi TaxID=112525 RepID=A0AAD8BUE5_BIOPF|nr:SET and MYND domain-containing protein 4 [Biomphalaria pfeifferi]